MADSMFKDGTFINFSLIALVGLTVILFMPSATSQDGMSGPASASMWGLGAMACGLFGLSAINMGLENVDHASFWKSLASVPQLGLVAVILWQIGISSMYYKRINQGKVPPQYNTFAQALLFLLFVQTIFVIFF